MLIRIQNHFDHRVCLGLKRRGQKSLWRRHGEPCSYRDNKVTDRDKITYIYIVDMSDALKSPWIIPPITFLRTIPLLQVSVRASVGLFARTYRYRPSEPPNDGAMARESALAVPPLSPTRHQIQQLWAAPLRARKSLLPLRPSPSSLCLPLSPSLPSVISRRVAATE